MVCDRGGRFDMLIASLILRVSDTTFLRAVFELGAFWFGVRWAKGFECNENSTPLSDAYAMVRGTVQHTHRFLPSSGKRYYILTHF